MWALDYMRLSYEVPQLFQENPQNTSLSIELQRLATQDPRWDWQDPTLYFYLGSSNIPDHYFLSRFKRPVPLKMAKSCKIKQITEGCMK